MRYRFLSFLTPDLIAVTIQTALVTVFYILRTYGTLVERLTDGKFDPSEGESAGVLIDDQFNSFLQLLDGSGVSATLITMIFWAAAGSLLYIFVFWSFQGLNAIASSANVSKSYTHGQQYNDGSFWSSFAARTGFRSVSGIVFMALLIGLLSFILPLFTAFYQEAVAGMPSLLFFMQIVGSIVATVLYVHIMTIFARFVALRPRLINPDQLH